MRAVRPASVIDVIVFIGGLSLLLAWRSSQIGPVVSGADPGDWLALGRAAIGHPIRAAAVVYPPLVPTVTGALTLAVGPLAAIKIVALGAYATSGIGMWILLKRLGTGVLGAVLAIAFAGSGYQSESLAWGAYPQMVALGLSLMFLAAAMTFLDRGGRFALLAAAAAAGLVALSSHFVLVWLVLLAGLLAVTQLVRQGRRVLPRIAVLAVTAGLACVPALPTYLMLAQRTVSGSGLNSGGATLLTSPKALLWGINEAPLLWLALAVAPLACLWLRGKRSGVQGTAAILLVSFLLPFVLSFESRLLFAVSAALVTGGAVLAHHLSQQRSWWLKTVAFISVGVIASGILVTSDVRFRSALRYYRVVDLDTVDALTWLDTQTPEGARVGVAQTERGHPLFWWVEGLGARPAWGAADSRFLSFRDERAEAMAAVELMSTREAPVAAALARQADLSYLFVDRTAADVDTYRQWLRTGADAPMTLVYSNPRIAIFEVAQRS